ncbi:MAG: NAD-dependent epimerase/dehydratase family protein [Terriglobales bacterium]
MKILVTGAAGFLGRAVVERLLAHGECELRCFVRPSSDLSGLDELRERYPDAWLEYVIGNLASPDDAFRAVEGVETIYHLAAGMRGLPASIFADTVVASKCLCDVVQDYVRRIVLVSSLGVYGTSFLDTNRLVEENTALDPHPEMRNVYFHAKIWQERLFRELAERGKVDLVVVRPGVLYGKGTPSQGFPSRVGIGIGNFLVMLGGTHTLPLTHVINCAEAVVLAGRTPRASGCSYNVVDDDLPTAREYVKGYKQRVKKVPTVDLPFPLTMLLAKAVEKYHASSHGQIPAVLTDYETRAMNKGHRFDNRKIKTLGWKQIVPTTEAMRETFEYLRASRNGDGR